MGILYVVATPIGNLKDITLRALEVLKEVNLILAEDTRVTKKLLFRYHIEKPIKSYHEHSGEGVYNEVLERLTRGEKIALVADGGTPGISDPGPRLVDYVREKLSTLNFKLSAVKIVPIPGPSALTAALSVSGVNANQFTFLGYPPHKKGRLTFFQALPEIKVKPVILFESPHRLLKTLTELARVFGDDTEITIIKELTKIHEEIFTGSIRGAQEYFTGAKGKGEFVLIVP